MPSTCEPASQFFIRYKTTTQKSVKSRGSHREDVVFASRGELLGRNEACFGLDKELSLLVSALDAVGDLSVGAVVTIGSDDSIHWLSPHRAFLLRLLPLRQLDFVDLLHENGPVVVLV